MNRLTEYFPTPPTDIEDVMGEHVYRQLTEWAYQNGHRAFEDGDAVRCECGEVFRGGRFRGGRTYTDRVVREHWNATRRLIRQPS